MAGATHILLDPRDDVAVAARGLGAGEALDGLDVRASVAIPRGHKIALRDLEIGAPIRKFAATIGVATAPIAAGDHVHVHNCAVAPEARGGVAASGAWIAPDQPPATFQGYRRANGRVGTRNYLGILTSVNCSATVAHLIAEAAERSGLLADHPGIDGIVPIVHGTGCGMADKGEGYELLQRTLWGYAANPNFGAVLMVGLGCEVIQIATFKERHGLVEGDAFRTFTIQERGGTRAAIEAGVAALAEMAPIAARARRETCPAGELVVGLQCGGSDGYSGITANPALGNAVDRLVALGGTALLSETPEIYGAEHLLLSRAVSDQVAADLRARLDWWRAYTERHGAEMDNNPSPGNKAGGLTTILEKSLGAVAKGGTAPLTEVTLYAQRARARGLVFMDSPGFDPCSATGQIAAGATILCFTTGRGSVFGAKPTPSLKLATNSELYARMGEDMDIDCGPIATGGASVTDKGAEILDAILATASGAPSKSEALGFGRAEFVPWTIGAVM